MFSQFKLSDCLFQLVTAVGMASDQAITDWTSLGPFPLQNHACVSVACKESVYKIFLAILWPGRHHYTSNSWSLWLWEICSNFLQRQKITIHYQMPNEKNVVCIPFFDENDLFVSNNLSFLFCFVFLVFSMMTYSVTGRLLSFICVCFILISFVTAVFIFVETLQGGQLVLWTHFKC